MPRSNADAAQEPRVIEAFASAAITALQESAQVEAFVEDCRTTEVLNASRVIAATIRLVREVPGTMTLLLTEQAAVELATRYLPKGTALSEEILNDVAGEFANVIAGQAKTALKGTAYHFALSTPSVVMWPSLSTWPARAEDSHKLAIAFDAQRLLLVIHLVACDGA